MTFLSILQTPTGPVSVLGPSPVPYLAGVTLTPAVITVTRTFLASDPVGTYFTYAGITVAGSDPFQAANQLSLGIQSFQFSP